MKSNRLQTAGINEQVANEVSCCHHWKIETNNQPVSHGYCKYCGAERDFSNLFEFPESIAPGRAKKGNLTPDYSLD
jgi:hypothetical protein